MSEIPEVDPMALTAEQPEPTLTEAAKDEILGDGIMSDKSVGDSTEGTGQPAEDPSPETAETQTTPAPSETEDEKAGRLRYDDYTRKSQERETQHQQRMDALAQRENEFLQRQQAQLDHQTQAEQQPQGQDLIGQLATAASNPNLSQEDRAGLGVIAHLVQTVQDQSAQLQGFAQFQQTVEPQFQQHESVIQNISTKQQQEVVGIVTTQMDEAKEKLGEETTAGSLRLVRQAFFQGGDVNPGNWAPPVKPGTQDPFTIAEYVAAISGRVLEAAQTATAQNGKVRQQAQLQASSIGADTATSDNSPLSRDQAIAEW